MENINQRIANKIRIERLIKGYSQEYMSLQLNMSQNAYSRIERGITKIDIERLQQIAFVLSVDLEKLILSIRDQ